MNGENNCEGEQIIDNALVTRDKLWKPQYWIKRRERNKKVESLKGGIKRSFRKFKEKKSRKEQEAEECPVIFNVSLEGVQGDKKGWGF